MPIILGAMIHFLPDTDTVTATSTPFEARVDGLAHALEVLVTLGADYPAAFTSMPTMGTNVSGMAEDMSDRIASASAAGLEAIAALRDAGLEANPAASQMLAEMIRDGLGRLGAVTSL